MWFAGIDLWLEYFQFSMGGIAEPGGLERIRQVSEAALQASGKHVGQGVLMWSAVREFENAILSTMQVACWLADVLVLRSAGASYVLLFFLVSTWTGTIGR